MKKLNVYCLQSTVSALLLERVPTLDASDDAQKSTALSIVNQFRWLDVSSEDSALLDKFLEVIGIVDPALQDAMIAFLPEVTTTDDQADRVGAYLLDRLEEDSAFCASVIETTPSLCISGDVRDRVCLKVLDHLRAVEASEVGKVARFVLENASAATAAEVVGSLREGLSLVDARDPRRRIPDRTGKGKGKKSERTPEQDLVSAVRSALRCKPEAIGHYLNFLKKLGAGRGRGRAAGSGSAEGTPSCCTLDVWVLVVLLSFGGDRAAQARQAFQRKVCAGQLSHGVVARSIKGHCDCLEEFFPSLLSLAAHLLRCNAVEASRAGVGLYCVLFECFPEARHRQDCLGELVAHLGGGCPQETSNALGCLARIAREMLDALRPFASYLAALLDHVDAFEGAQARELFWVIGEVLEPDQGEPSGSGSQGSRRGSRLEDEVHITIRKQMSSDSPRYFRTGVVGSLALLARRERGIESCHNPSRRTKEVCVSLGRIFRECSRNPENLGFFFEEVAEILARGGLCHRRVLECLNELAAVDFEQTFIGEFESGRLAAEDARGGEPWFNLDGENAEVALRIFPLAVSGDKEEQLQLAKLPAQISLLQVLENKQSGNLEAINALLGCPLHLFPEQALDECAAEARQDLAKVLVHAVNWCREILRVFTEGVDLTSAEAVRRERETLRKVVRRAGNTYVLEACLAILRQRAADRRGRFQPKSPGGAGTQTSVATAATTASTAGGDASSIADLGSELDKAAKTFNTPEPRPFKQSHFALLFLALPGPRAEVGDGDSLLACLVYLLRHLRRECVVKGGAFATAEDVVGFRPTEGGAETLPLALGALQDLFLERLGQEPPTEATQATQDSTVMGAATRLAEDHFNAPALGLELISDVVCNTILKCDGPEVLRRFAEGFLGGGEGAAGPVQGFLDAMAARYDIGTTFDQKYKSAEVLVTAYKKLEGWSAGREGEGEGEGENESAARDLGVDLEELKRQAERRVGELLTGPDPSSLSKRKPGLPARAKVVDSLVGNYALLCEQPLDKLEEIASSFERYARHALDKAPKPGDSPFPLLDRQTIPSFYSCLFRWLCSLFRAELAASVEDRSRLDGVHRCACVFTKLVLLPKRAEKGSVLLKPIVQGAHGFLESLSAFDRQGLHQHEAVTQILKELQKGVKHLQFICSDCKTQKSTFLASKVPALKRSVERFNWKCLLWQHNKDGTKVQMGSLKHRDARGNAILSQLELSEFDFNRSAIGVEEDVEEDSQKSLLIDQSLPLSFEI